MNGRFDEARRTEKIFGSPMATEAKRALDANCSGIPAIGAGMVIRIRFLYLGIARERQNSAVRVFPPELLSAHFVSSIWSC